MSGQSWVQIPAEARDLSLLQNIQTHSAIHPAYYSACNGVSLGVKLSLILREESRLRVFENRVLRKIFGPKRNKVIEEWRKLHNEELNDLYFSPTVFRVINWRRMRWAGQVAHMRERKVVYRVLVGKSEGKRPFGRLGHRWEDNIKMDLQEARCRGMDWIELVPDKDRWRALVTAVMNLRVPYNAGNFLTS
jgi:hypothetical protein